MSNAYFLVRTGFISIICDYKFRLFYFFFIKIGY